MSTRYSKTKQFPGAIDYGYEGTDVPDDIEVPTCTIEDVDRALFELFNKEIPSVHVIKVENHQNTGARHSHAGFRVLNRF